MNTSLIGVRKILKKYHGFDDGLIVSFEYSYLEDESLSAKIVIYARNHEHPGNEWRKVEIMMSAVEELCVKAKSNQINSISLGVRLLDFGDVFCIDVDGNYNLAEGPASLDEVRRYGDCYLIGRGVSAEEIG